MAEWKEVSSWMYVKRKNISLTEIQMEVIKESRFVCGLGLVTGVWVQYVYISAIKRYSELYRGINYCVIGNTHIATQICHA